MEVASLADRPTKAERAAETRPDALISVKEVSAMLGLKSASPVYDRLRRGEFPEPIRLSARCTRWRLRDVQAWIEAQRVAQQ